MRELQSGVGGIRARFWPVGGVIRQGRIGCTRMENVNGPMPRTAVKADRKE